MARFSFLMHSGSCRRSGRIFALRAKQARPKRDAFNYGTPDAYDFYLRVGPLQNFDEKFFHGKIEYWKELIDNDTYSAYWQERNARRYMHNIKPAMLTVGGWFDAEDLFGAVRLYEAMEKQNPGANNNIVMGPWLHGGWSRGFGDRLGHVSFQSKTSEYFRDSIEFPFFLYHLKGKGEGKLPEAYMFETGRKNGTNTINGLPRKRLPKTLYFADVASCRYDRRRQARHSTNTSAIPQSRFRT